MASTRDKRLKTDSPTPVTNDTPATTPTTKSTTAAIKLKRMSRNRSGALSGKSEVEDGNDSVGLSEDTQSSTASVEPPKTPNTRTKRAKDEKEDEPAADAKEAEELAKEASKEIDAKKMSKNQLQKKKAATMALARRAALLKRNSLPLPVKSSLRNISRRLSAGSKTSENVKEEAQPVAKKGKAGRKAAIPVAVIKKEEDPIADEVAEAIPEPAQEAEIAEKPEEVSMEKAEIAVETEAEAKLKQEKSDKAAAAALSLDLQNVRRSTRQRKSTIKDRDSPFAGRKSQARDKSETKRDSVSPASIKIEKESSKAISITVEPAEATAEKDPSLSPELVSEEMDTESVQHMYDKPDFLENNLGIEKDPKLGEIVKVQEKTKTVVESVIKSEEKIQEDIEMKEPEIEVPKVEKEVKLEEPKVEEKVEEKVNGEKNEKESTETAEVEPPKDVPEESTAKIDEKIEATVEKPEEKEVKVIKSEPKVEKPKAMEEKSEKLQEKVENHKETEEKLEIPTKDEESLEENKENNIESSAKSIGSNSPRSEDRLKIVSEENVPKIELNPAEQELLKQKESHLKSLGLLTHKAADEAKVAKLKRKEELIKTLASQVSQSSKNSKSKKESSSGGEQYTGTLKTIIKLNRTDKEKRKTRMPLKMTFQKKNRDRDSNGSANSSDSFYTIQEKDATAPTESHGAISRKSHNRSYNHDQVATSSDQNKTHEPVVNKEIDQSLVIPEKASSFKVHPERLCKDQCFYCGGKFGLYDTPCHIAQIKSEDRQKKILDSEEKLTKDSCLCDACFRHVDRRANCPSYKSKRLSTPADFQGPSTSSQPHGNPDRTYGICNVVDCNETAAHNIRKKWFLKLKKTIAKIFQVNLDAQPNNANVSICEEHFSAMSHIMVCAMCKRKLPRNHIFYINQDIARLETLIAEQGLNLKLSNSTLVVCKLCSYFNNLLFKPPEPKTQKADFVKNYSKKLLKQNNIVISVDDDEVQEVPVRNDNLTLTIRNGKIQPKKSTQQALSNEVTITSTKSPTASGSMMLDNEVMVGYDLPFPLESCPSPPAHAIRNPNYKGPPQKPPQGKSQESSRKGKDDNNEMARALKSNPNISMRELFPGEEEMGLKVNLPFNTSQRTTDGWFKTQMTVQYDEVSKALWEHLQRPYGNQSSFLRHLILLEKYYRNGDLVLSQSASSSATTYSQSVRNRLRSYDNIPSTSPIPGANFSNSEISITPAPKVKSKPQEAVTITPQPGGSLLKRKASQCDVNSPSKKVMKSDDSTPKKTSPPELISFTQKTVTKSKSSTSSAEPNPSSQTLSSNGNVIVLPDKMTPQEREICTKSWRPTLIPITGGANALLNSGGPLYQTADGRKLPALVQVMSGGKPYHISIADYNRMCIIRREKILNQKRQQQHQSAAENGGSASSGGSPARTLPSTSSSLSIIPMPKERDTSSKPTTHTTSPSQEKSSSTARSGKIPNIPNQILEQNSLIPINSNSEANGKRHHNGTSSAPPPLTSVKTLHNNLMAMSQTVLGASALSQLSKTVNSLQPAAQLEAWKALWNESDTNGDNMAALAQIANLANLSSLNAGGLLMDTSLLSKIPKSLTVIPQAKPARRHNDEPSKPNSAST